MELSNSTLVDFTKTAIILVSGIAIVISNVLIIVAIRNFREAAHCYLLSLAVADLLCGLFIVPLSVYPSITGKWEYGSLACNFVGYLEVILWSVTIYTLMWISFDRYLAISRPLHYQQIQTKTRCQCWLALTWILSALLCCPPLLSYREPIFDDRAFICKLDWEQMPGYSVTAAILVLGPSIPLIIHSLLHIFFIERRLSVEPIHDRVHVQASAKYLAEPSHKMAFALVAMFCVSWCPFIFVRMFELCFGKVDTPILSFSIVWLGALNSFWKVFIISATSPQIRSALRGFCLPTFCMTEERTQDVSIGLDPLE
ncbi:G-protein coupled receptor 52-like [Bradysia coprophila]|uniref:G-protein coupled receptor 52-like n=1 Tax=Bradysia coprophila TaxID=38358 RepID=UPI00187DAD00|nr:G-protein coupled receptor 52-like [Bradysia coprophila]